MTASSANAFVSASLTSAKSAASTPRTRSAKKRSTWSTMTSSSARVRSQAAAQSYSATNAVTSAAAAALSALLGSEFSSYELSWDVSNASRVAANRSRGSSSHAVSSADNCRAPSSEALCSSEVGLGGSSSNSTTRRKGYSCRAAESSVLRTVDTSSRYDGTNTVIVGSVVSNESSMTARGTRRCARVRYKAPC